jgi:hypothetical protein
MASNAPLEKPVKDGRFKSQFRTKVCKQLSLAKFSKGTLNPSNA